MRGPPRSGQGHAWGSGGAFCLRNGGKTGLGHALVMVCRHVPLTRRRSPQETARGDQRFARSAEQPRGQRRAGRHSSAPAPCLPFRQRGPGTRAAARVPDTDRSATRPRSTRPPAAWDEHGLGAGVAHGASPGLSARSDAIGQAAACSSPSSTSTSSRANGPSTRRLSERTASG